MPGRSNAGSQRKGDTGYRRMSTITNRRVPRWEPTVNRVALDAALQDKYLECIRYVGYNAVKTYRYFSSTDVLRVIVDRRLPIDFEIFDYTFQLATDKGLIQGVRHDLWLPAERFVA